MDYSEENLNGFNGFTDLASFLKDKNSQTFNDKIDYRIFIVEYPYSYNIGIVTCTPEQARELNELGVLRYDWMKRTRKEFEFMKYN